LEELLNTVCNVAYRKDITKTTLQEEGLYLKQKNRAALLSGSSGLGIQ
jgi:hypothetical protein